MVLLVLLCLFRLFATLLTCSDCYGVSDKVMTRLVRRMQPEAQNATSRPRGPLEWGDINFMHTTDTHGWLEGHLKEKNYGADWGDFVSFTSAMKRQARQYGVDLLLVDTGDLHDGAGISDVTTPNGLLSNPIWENVDYDLLTIGNHELYVTEIAYEHFNQFAKVYGDRYLTSNVQILNPATKQFEYIGNKYRYFTTEQGLRIMAFGVLFDFTGHSNVSKVIKANEMVQQSWFTDAVNCAEPVDLFLVLGHNPARPDVASSTMGVIYSAIRMMRPDVPIQGFGGHTHIRDFVVYDNKATMIESGRYCETLGWVAIDGLKPSTGDSDNCPRSGIPRPTRCAEPSSPEGLKNVTVPPSTSPSKIKYARRYLDWNRLTFDYHAKGSQTTVLTEQGKAVSAEITGARQELNLTTLFGCAPRTYCQTCKPYGVEGNINTLLEQALAAVVVNEQRKDKSRILLINSGSTRFDLTRGPFTLDDAYIVSPFKNTFKYIPDVPYSAALQIVSVLERGSVQKRDLGPSDTAEQMPVLTSSFDTDSALNTECMDPLLTRDSYNGRTYRSGRLVRRQETVTPGPTTKDDFGTDGDDTVHSKIPSYRQPKDLQGKAAFPADGRDPETVDVIFVDFIASYILNALKSAGAEYDKSKVQDYLPPSFTSNDYLPLFAKKFWQQNVPNCPIGEGVGYDS